MKQELIIKNMVCERCIRVVKEELEAVGFSPLEVQLGKAVVTSQRDDIDLKIVRRVLEDNGFELLVDKKASLVEKIKIVIINLIYQNQLENLNRNLSDVIADEVGRDYSYLSNLFSSVERITIEKYIILQKIERVKELLVYEELTLSEIAYQVGYSSVQHLSGQFKSVTGLTPSHFKSIRTQRRILIDKLGSPAT
ncbi:MAG: helix-turn-helix domain-containing protein [Candidatus Marinimicrobia bacterium]|nr:helix-turn-helix domain-containing protein [Candidatus Neomarinimicrobiota bacterium]